MSVINTTISLILRMIKNTALTYSELDNNFTKLKTAIESHSHSDFDEIKTFTPAGAGAVPTTVQNKLSELVSVKDFGAVGDFLTDDTVAIQAAIDYVGLAGGGVLFYPKGNYRVTGELTTTSNAVIHRGECQLATTIWQALASSNTFVFESTQFSGVSNMSITNIGTATNGYAIVFHKTAATGCFFGVAEDIYIYNTYNGILIESCAETRVRRCHLRGLLGTRGILFTGTGTGADGSYRALIDDCVCDTGGNGNTAISWYSQDNYAYSFVLENCTALYGGIGVSMFDSANTGTSYPMWCYANDLECDHNHTAGVNLSWGEGFYMTNSWIGSTLSGSGINIAGTFRGETDIGNSRVMGCYQNGISIAAGPVDTYIHDNIIGDNSVAGYSSYHGIVISANSNRFTIVGNRIGDVVGVSGNNQGYGIFILGGTSADFIISQNNLKGNAAGGLFDGATGTDGRIESNIGYNPVGIAGVVAGASPYTYTAGHAPETLYLIGGTITHVKDVLGNLLLNGVTNVPVMLGPNEQIVITYTVAPAINKYKH